MKRLKSLIIAIMMFVLTLALAACGTTVPDDNGGKSDGDGSTTTTTTTGGGSDTTIVWNDCVGDNILTRDSKVLIAYFSASYNNTRMRAMQLREKIGADAFRIQPAVPYTSADLNYGDSSSRTSIEQNDPSSRPEMLYNLDIAQYEVIYIGYPIWWGQAPKILYTFVEAHDFSGKTVIPFCTSGSSGIGSSAENLAKCTTGATWKTGLRVGSDSDIDRLVEMK